MTLENISETYPIISQQLKLTIYSWLFSNINDTLLWICTE